MSLIYINQLIGRIKMKKRELYTKQLSSYIDKPMIKVITGIRRSGKSFLLKLIKEELISRKIDENNIIYINYESLKLEKYRDYSSLYKFVMSKIKNKDNRYYLLIDEIQEVNDWEKLLDHLQLKLIVTSI